jgi:hypothetical protein
MKHENLRELCKEKLLGASTLLAVVALPVWDGEGTDSLCDCVRDRLLPLGRGDGELRERVRLHFLMRAIGAPNGVSYPEPQKLVKEGHFVGEKLNQFVGVANVVACRHTGRCLDTLVEGPQSLFSIAAPDFREACFHGVAAVFVSPAKASLEVRDAEDGLKCCVDPTGSILVAKTEHDYFWKAEKSVRNGTGSVLEA